jgi:hypothetical protein
LDTSKKEYINITMPLSRTDFSVFDSSDPCDWLMNNQYYFGLYQVNDDRVQLPKGKEEEILAEREDEHH